MVFYATWRQIEKRSNILTSKIWVFSKHVQILFSSFGVDSWSMTRWKFSSLLPYLIRLYFVYFQTEAVFYDHLIFFSNHNM